MKVTIVKRYKDLELDRMVEKNEVLTVNEDRGKQLIEANVAVKAPTKRKKVE